MEKLNTEKKEKKLGFIVLIVSIVVCLITVSYALWSNVYKGKKENTLKTGTLVLRLNDKSKNISILNAIPLNDNKGLKQDAYIFSLQNTGSTDANYRLSIVDDTEYYKNDNCMNNKLDWSFLRYSFEEGNTTPVIGDLGEHDGILKEGTIGAGDEIDFSLRIWLNGKTTQTESGKHFHSKIKIDSVQSNQTLVY